MDVSLLRAFDALLTEGSVSRASVRLNLSQPATSALLAKLRELFGDPLFVRTARGVAPTERARQLGDPVRRLLGDLQALLDPPEHFDPVKSERVFQVATTDYLGVTLLADVAQRLIVEAPRVRLAVVSAHLGTLAARLASGEVDAAALARGRMPKVRDMRAHALFDESFVLAMRPDHPLARRRRLKVADLASAPHVYVSPQHAGFSGDADRALQALGAQRWVQISAASFAAALDVVARSDFVAVLPRRLVAAQAGRVLSRPLPFDMPGFTFDWISHARTDHDAGVRWLRQLFHEAANRL